MSKKRSIIINDIADAQRALDDIYDTINKLIISVNNIGSKFSDNVSGKPGDIRILKNEDGVSVFQVKTKEGWSSLKDSSNEIIKIELN
jgi:uncharacterized membrane protein YkoI